MGRLDGVYECGRARLALARAYAGPMLMRSFYSALEQVYPSPFPQLLMRHAGWSA